MDYVQPQTDALKVTSTLPPVYHFKRITASPFAIRVMPKMQHHCVLTLSADSNQISKPIQLTIWAMIQNQCKALYCIVSMFENGKTNGVTQLEIAISRHHKNYNGIHSL